MKKTKFLTSLFFLSLCCLTAETFSQVVDNFGAPIKKALATYDEAFNRKDVKAVEKILAPSYVYFSSTGGTMSRKQIIDFLNFSKIRFRIR